MTKQDPAFCSAAQLAGMIRSGQTTSAELTHYFIDRIEKHDDKLNAVVVRVFEAALEAARRADEMLARGQPLGPLHGVPMTVKESNDLAGTPTTWGFPALRDNIAAEDAVVVARLKAAGAVIMGKTNVPLGLEDYQSYNDIYGTTNNPWDPARSPGGSSGGAAAALAAGLTGLESGSDIAGSIRNPAHYCGVYGHKPTYGIVPLQGHSLGAAADIDLAVLGPLARSAEDLAIALDVVAGADRYKAPGWRLDLPPARAKSLDGLRVALWPSDRIAEPEAEIAERIHTIGDMLRKSGAIVADDARPDFSAEDSHRTYVNLLGSAIGAAAPDDVHRHNMALAAEMPQDDDSFLATMARAALLDHRAWAQTNETRAQLRLAWQRFFAGWDVVLCPIMVTTAFEHDRRPQRERRLNVNGADVPYYEQSFWAGLASVAGLPSTTFPTGLSNGGLPIGLQAIGAEYADRTTIEAARLIAEEIGGFAPPPAYVD
jgi:amidase